VGDWEEEGGQVAASGGSICWIFLAWDIVRVDNALARVCKVVDPSKDDVCWAVPAMALPPSLDNTPVVTIDFEMVTIIALW
jgi:hypothetical protein